MKVPVGISARHAHVSRKDLDILFGEGYELTHFKDLSQPGQYACDEKITLETASGKVIEGIRILGPTRPATQVEISKSDAIRLKLDAPVRSSGDIEGSAAGKLIGPNGTVEINEGIIISDRHIHMSLEDGKKFGINDREIVKVEVEGIKGGVMYNVLCRVNESFALDFHIDTDDACAFGLGNKDQVTIIK